MPQGPPKRAHTTDLDGDKSEVQASTSGSASSLMLAEFKKDVLDSVQRSNDSLKADFGAQLDSRIDATLGAACVRACVLAWGC